MQERRVSYPLYLDSYTFFESRRSGVRACGVKIKNSQEVGNESSCPRILVFKLCAYEYGFISVVFFPRAKKGSWTD